MKPTLLPNRELVLHGWDFWDKNELVDLWNEHEVVIREWLDAMVTYYGDCGDDGYALILPTGVGYYPNASEELMDTSNSLAFADQIEYLGLDLSNGYHEGTYYYRVDLGLLDSTDWQALAVQAWLVQGYIFGVYPLLNEDHYYELDEEAKSRRAEEDVEGFTSEEEWLSNYGHGHDLSYTGYGNDVGDLPSDYVQELATEAGTSEWRELAFHDRLNFYDYYGIDY